MQPKRYDTVSLNPGKPHDSPPPRHSKEDLQEVSDVRKMVELGHWPSEFLANESGGGDDVPELLASRRALRLSKRRPTAAALVVTMDDPYSLGEELHKELRARGVRYKEDSDHTRFAEPEFSRAAFARDLASANAKALWHAFEVKYHYKAVRPEARPEVLVAPCVFCVDDFGAPNHWAYPAGHGATSGSALAVLRAYFDLDEDMDKLVFDACYQFAHWRTLLGVHFREDNDEGLRIGLKYAA